MTAQALHDDPLLRGVPRVGGYPLLSPCLLYGLIGQGGMGSVYLARHLRLGLDVAVKCLRPDIADRADSWVVRFQREAGLAARINHQNLVRAYDVLRGNGLNYLVMEVVHGENLRQRVERLGAHSADEACAIVAQAASGLAAAHAAGVVHRDVKPDNVLFSLDRQVKLADLGLAKALEITTGGSEATLHTTVMGTPQYMAPEQWVDTKTVGPRADVFSLAATLWFLLAGRDGRPKASMRELMQRGLGDPFPSVSEVRDDLPPELARLLDRSTALNDGERPQDAQAFLHELTDCVGTDVLDLAPAGSATSWTPPRARPTPEVLDEAKDAISDEAVAVDGAVDGPAADAGPSGRSRFLVAFAMVVLLLVVAAFAVLGGDCEAVPERIAAQPLRIGTSRQVELREATKQVVDVTWHDASVKLAVADLEDLAGLPIRADYRLLDEQLADLGEAAPTVWFDGPASVEALLDLVCGACSDVEMAWAVGRDQVELGPGEDLEEVMVRLYDIAPLVCDDAQTVDVRELVAEFVRSEEWYVSDLFQIDWPSAGVLSIIHEPRAQAEVESFLNRLLHHDRAREDGLVNQVLDHEEALVAPGRFRGSSVRGMIQGLAESLGLAVEIEFDDLERLPALEQEVDLVGQSDPLRDVLGDLSLATGLHFRIGDDRILVSDNRWFQLEPFLVIYDVSAITLADDDSVRAPEIVLLPSGTDTESYTEGIEEAEALLADDTLSAYIVSNIDPVSWSDDPDIVFGRFGDLLLIKTHARTHRNIRSVLDGLEVFSDR